MPGIYLYAAKPRKQQQDTSTVVANTGMLNWPGNQEFDYNHQ